MLLSLRFIDNSSKNNSITKKIQINKFLFLTISILLLSFSIKSTINMFNLNKFVSAPQSRELLCASQTLDYSLKNTPAGSCDAFEEKSNQKSKFDSW